MQVEKLRAVLSDPKGMLSNIPALPLPLDPEKRVCSILAGKNTSGYADRSCIDAKDREIWHL